MSKKKNTSNQNAARKDHRNGIKQPDKSFLTTKGMDQKILDNLAYSRKYNGIGRAKYEELHGKQD
ncbi:hypothetical protein M153_3930001060 [Pseudoloma neurophilia]|uniref:60S ribosomal protein L29 n=1 Tax=Pseudoloma neurophilia TaxID=146866 RepID=A0A0R0M3K2_9MICR|nr:hypothetical protein M153_3930001060 [Pseudoloma neurophilia]